MEIQNLYMYVYLGSANGDEETDPNAYSFYITPEGKLMLRYNEFKPSFYMNDKGLYFTKTTEEYIPVFNLAGKALYMGKGE